MAHTSDNETWIIETGDLVIRKKVKVGISALSAWEVLVYCVWVADYGIRNAGDLETAADVHSTFHSDARTISKQLSLPVTHAAFGLSKADLEREYLDRFDAICEELKSFGSSNS